MPTKPNRAGQEQNYVPQGNGDASGEYADNESGSNIHFTNFKKPEEKQTGNFTSFEKKETIVEEPKKETKTRIDELNRKQKKEIGSYVFGKSLDDYNETQKANLIRVLRYYSGSFGDLSNFSDEELWNIAKEFAGANKQSENVVWYKSGSKWKGTRNIGLLEKQGIKYYTSEEKEIAEKEKNEKLVEKSQSGVDKEIQGLMGKQCVVCFGKGYSQEDLTEIKDATQNLIKDWGDLTSFVANMGDRNNLEKYLNAIRSQQTFSESMIAERIEKIKKMYYFGLPSEERLREQAIQSLQGKVEFRRIGNAYAYWSESSKSMIFQGIMKTYNQEQSKREFDSNFKSSDKKISVYYHEMGHAVDSMIEDIKYKKQEFINDWKKGEEFRNIVRDFQDKKQELIRQNYNEKFSPYTLKAEFEKRYGKPYVVNSENIEKMQAIKDELKGEKMYRLSEYGATNDKEFVAESFAAYYTDMNNPLANQLVELYKNFYKQLREFN